MSTHDETWNKCHICGQTIKTYHGSYHDSGWCKDMPFEEYDKPKKEMKQEDLQYQNKILRAAIEGKDIIFKSKRESWEFPFTFTENNKFDFEAFDYKIKEEVEEPVLLDFICEKMRVVKNNLGEEFSVIIKGSWRFRHDLRAARALDLSKSNPFILLTDSVKKALDKEGIKYE